ncbi:MAG: hypothetical protein N3H31_07790 [Candidatus Nezhaarchaeota archaeon]|nr:hypothetical protein [Candidatus Nezhaarchaeota archaeon]
MLFSDDVIDNDAFLDLADSVEQKLSIISRMGVIHKKQNIGTDRGV